MTFLGSKSVSTAFQILNTNLDSVDFRLFSSSKAIIGNLQSLSKFCFDKMSYLYKILKCHFLHARLSSVVITTMKYKVTPSCKREPDLALHSCNPNVSGSEERRFQVLGFPELHDEI